MPCYRAVLGRGGSFDIDDSAATDAALPPVDVKFSASIRNRVLLPKLLLCTSLSSRTSLHMWSLLLHTSYPRLASGPSEAGPISGSNGCSVPDEYRSHSVPLSFVLGFGYLGAHGDEREQASQPAGGRDIYVCVRVERQPFIHNFRNRMRQSMTCTQFP